jgi:hypothetical protein
MRIVKWRSGAECGVWFNSKRKRKTEDRHLFSKDQKKSSLSAKYSKFLMG